MVHEFSSQVRLFRMKMLLKIFWIIKSMLLSYKLEITLYLLLCFLSDWITRAILLSSQSCKMKFYVLMIFLSPLLLTKIFLSSCDSIYVKSPRCPPVPSSQLPWVNWCPHTFWQRLFHLSPKRSHDLSSCFCPPTVHSDYSSVCYF